MDNDYNLDGKSFVVESNAGENALLPPGSQFHFQQKGNEVTATYSGGRVVKGTLTGHIVDDKLHHRYTETLKDGRRLSGRATIEISRRENGLLELRDRWAWESEKGEGLCVLVETREIGKNTGVPSEELTKEKA